MSTPRISANSEPYRLRQSGAFGYGVGYREGSRVVPIPTTNYRTAERPREHWAIALNSCAHLLPAFTAGCPAFWLSPLHYRFGMIVLPDAHQNPGSRRYRPAHRSDRRGSGSADRFGQQVRAKLASGFLATATIRCRNNCELVCKNKQVADYTR
jgi:hypothetical protein